MFSIGNVVRSADHAALLVVIDQEENRYRHIPLEPVGHPAGIMLTVDGEAYACVPSRASWGSLHGEVTGTLDREQLDALLRGLVRSEVRNYHDRMHVRAPGPVTGVPASGKKYDAREMELLTDSALDFWLTTGRFNAEFEAKFGEFLGLPHVLTCNSGSSANLLAVAALTSPKLEERRLVPGDEVITVAAGFPTTVNPLLLYGLVPVFVDVDIPTYNIDTTDLERAVTPRTKAIMLAHTLGNPFNVDAVLRLARKHGLWVIEDCCDALGTRYDSEVEKRNDLVGTFGDIATFSFYPAHHITMGEGGAVATRDASLKKLIESFRDWGRDCWCPPGRDNTCKCRFEWKLGNLPQGYDHKYTYSHIGFNLKITDMQAAVGLGQLEKLEEFIAIRRSNFEYLTAALEEFRDVFILPEATDRSTPSWFGYPITLREDAPADRESLMRFLANRNVGTRLLFGGNLTCQPYFQDVCYRVAEQSKLGETPLPNTDQIMRRTFWIGVYQGIGQNHIDYIVKSLKDSPLSPS